MLVLGWVLVRWVAPVLLNTVLSEKNTGPCTCSANWLKAWFPFERKRCLSLSSDQTYLKLTEYLQKSRDERTVHVDLSTPCVLDEKVGSTTQSKRGREALLKRLGVEDDVVDWRSERVCCAHLCEHDSQRGWCTNPLHLYLGTPSENSFDLPEEVRKARSVKAGKKGGPKGGSKGGQSTTSQLWVSLHDGFVSNVLNVAKHNRAVAASEEYRVQLTKEEVENYEPLFEAFNYMTYTLKGRALKKTARRVPEQVLEALRGVKL